MEQSKHWIDKLGDQVEKSLDALLDDQDETLAAIFVAVETVSPDQKLVAFDIRGRGHALAEAVGSLIYDRRHPPEIAVAAYNALKRRMDEGDAPLPLLSLNLPSVNLNEVKPDKKLLK